MRAMFSTSLVAHRYRSKCRLIAHEKLHYKADNNNLFLLSMTYKLHPVGKATV